jgi:hypothetical protein
VIVVAYYKKPFAGSVHVIGPLLLSYFISTFILSVRKGKALSSKKRRKKQRPGQQPINPSKLVFTFTDARILKDALDLVEEAFIRNTRPLPNLEFGMEVLAGLKQKIDDMLQGEDWDNETPFDSNEMHLLYAAIHMYLVDVSLARNEQLMPICLQLCKQFSLAIETLPPQQLKPTPDS